MKNGSRFDIKCPRDFLHKIVIPQHEDFVMENSSTRHALLAIIVVYHMYEWVHKEKFTKEKFLSKYRDYKKKEEMADMFDLARKIANDTKHFLSNVTTEVQIGFSSDFSDEFQRPLNVEFGNGSQTSVDILLSQMVEFWVDQERLDFGPYAAFGIR